MPYSRGNWIRDMGGPKNIFARAIKGLRGRKGEWSQSAANSFEGALAKNLLKLTKFFLQEKNWPSERGAALRIASSIPGVLPPRPCDVQKWSGRPADSRGKNWNETFARQDCKFVGLNLLQGAQIGEMVWSRNDRPQRKFILRSRRMATFGGGGGGGGGRAPRAMVGNDSEKNLVFFFPAATQPDNEGHHVRSLPEI